MKYNGKKIYKSILISVICCAFILCGCGKKEAKESVVSDRTVQAPTESPYSENVQELVDALEATANLPSFSIKTKTDMEMKGKLIKGEYLVGADVDIVNDLENEKLQMIMHSTSDFDEPADGYYVDGWYYSNDKTGKFKEEQTRDQVMSQVTNITGIVKDNADSIENLSIQESGEDTIYSYTIPPEMAQDYLDQIMEGALEHNEELNGATANLESLELQSTVNKEGLVTRQKLFATGDVKKAILKVPAEIDVTAEFVKNNKTSLKMPSFKGYTER